MIVVTKQFDALDALCYQQYGRTEQACEMVLACNPGLARLLPILPEGLAIEFPIMPASSSTRTAQIWGSS